LGFSARGLARCRSVADGRRGGLQASTSALPADQRVARGRKQHAGAPAERNHRPGRLGRGRRPRPGRPRLPAGFPRRFQRPPAATPPNPFRPPPNNCPAGPAQSAVHARATGCRPGTHLASSCCRDSFIHPAEARANGPDAGSIASPPGSDPLARPASLSAFQAHTRRTAASPREPRADRAPSGNHHDRRSRTSSQRTPGSHNQPNRTIRPRPLRRPPRPRPRRWLNPRPRLFRGSESLPPPKPPPELRTTRRRSSAGRRPRPERPRSRDRPLARPLRARPGRGGASCTFRS